MVSTEQNVREILGSNLFSRDDDNLLMLLYWKKHDSLDKNISRFDQWWRNEATPPETLRRTRQKLQQDYPYLRGKAWNVRHDQGDLVREAIVKS